MGKTLVAYFSASGTTAMLAESIAEAADADLFEIAAKKPYSAADLDWTNRNSRSSVEMNDPAARPAYTGEVEDWDGYDTVFVGFPIWWYVEPRIIDTFLEAHDFTGKTVVPFATSGGSGFGDTDAHMQGVCGSYGRWVPGRVFNGNPQPSALEGWIEGLGL